MTTPRRSLPPSLVRALLAVWCVVMLAGGADLLGLHMIPLRGPSMDPAALASAIARVPFASKGWRMVHVLYTDCLCSASVLEHLLERGVVADAETIVVVGAGSAAETARMRARGFEVLETTTTAASAELGLEGAPMLIVVRPSGEIAYAGGYTRAKRAALVADLGIYRSIRAGGVVEPLPIFGCALDEQTRRRTDPLGLR